MRAPRWAWVLCLTAFLTILGAILGAILLKSLGWTLLLTGAGVLEIAGPLLFRHVQFLKRAHQADGIIIGYHENSLPGEESSWYPIVRYTLPNGQEITFRSTSSTFRIRKSRPVSTKVGVLYDPNNPERAVINRPLEKFDLFFVVLFALFFLVPGILLLVGLIHQGSN